MDFEQMKDAVRLALADDHCLLCGTPVSTWLDEFACPHWFLTHGKVGLHPEKLAGVFEAFDPIMVVSYLKTITAGGRGHRGRTACCEWEDPAGRHVRIDWRLRTWQFSFAPGSALEDDPLRGFVLRTFYRGAAVAQGRIELSAGPKRVRYTALAEQAEPAAATVSP